MRLKAAVIGCGWFGNAHARVYRTIRNVDLVAVADKNFKRAKSVANGYGCRAYEDHISLLEKEDVDLLSIAVTPQYLVDIALESIEYNVNILLEKPLSTKLEKYEKLVQKVKKASIVFMPGFIELFNPAYRVASGIIRNGELGEIYNVSARRIGRTPKRGLKWEVGVTLDLAIHELYVLEDLFGDVKIVGSYKSMVLGEPYEDVALIVLRMKNKAMGLIEVNWITPTSVRELRVSGSRGSLKLDYKTQTVEVNYSGGLEAPYIRNEEPLKRELEYFASSVSGGSKPYPDEDFGLKVLRMVFKAVKNALQI